MTNADTLAAIREALARGLYPGKPALGWLAFLLRRGDEAEAYADSLVRDCRRAEAAKSDMQRWIDHHSKRADDAEAERDDIATTVQRQMVRANELARDLTLAEAERDRLRETLESIAKNTCCGTCHEAALVAYAALAARPPEEAK